VNQTNVTHLNRDPRSYGADTRPASVTPRPPFNHGDKPKFVAKGHDAQLQDAQINKHPTTLTLMSGDKCTGVVVKRDKYTITIRHTTGENAGFDEIFYKHAIEGVLIKRESGTVYKLS
jgi:sRNA-binding regulator protein Hfq